VETVSNVLLVASLLLLAASVVTLLAQIIKDGLKAVNRVPSVFFALYVITFTIWIALSNL